MRILSLFSGIGAFEKALSNLGVPFTLVNYCEIDKYASKSYSAIHGVSEELNLWDVTKVDTDKLADFDLMTWGFPCQDISVAGKQSGIEVGTRSGLYYEGMRILRAKRPSISIVENVKNLVSKKFQEQFKQILRDHWELGYYTFFKVLNAKNYGIPQNRERVFVIAIQHDYYHKHFKENGKEFEWPTPFDNGLRLKDMLEDEVDEKYYISDDKVQKLLGSLNKGKGVTNYNQASGLYLHDSLAFSKDLLEGESRCLKANKLDSAVAIPCLTPDRAEKRQNGRRFKEDGEPMFTLTGQDRHGVMQVGSFDKEDINDNERQRIVYSENGISPTILARTDNAKVLQVGNIVDTGNFENPQTGRVYSTEGCSPTLNTCGGGQREPKVMVKEATKLGYAIAEPGDSINIQFPNSETRRGRVGHEVAQTIETSCNQATIQNYRIRKLTPTECFRLMAFSDTDIQKCIDVGISNSQLYKQAGNSICVNVLEEIFKKLLGG